MSEVHINKTWNNIEDVVASEVRNHGSARSVEGRRYIYMEQHRRCGGGFRGEEPLLS